MTDRWFLEKKGKYYGPFKADKVLAYAQQGKIGPNTMVARDARGSGACPFSDLEARLQNPEEDFDDDVPEAAPAPVPTQPAPEEAGDQGPALRDEPNGVAREWYISTPERRFGPYSLPHLEELLREGKLKPDDRLQHEGRSHLSLVSEVLPQAAAPKPATKSTAPKGVAPTAKPAKPTKPTKAARPKARKPPTSGPKKGKKRMAFSVLLLAPLLVAAAVWYFRPFDPAKDPRDKSLPGGKVMAELKRKYEQTSALRRQMAVAELPPFNQLAMDALREGLNFHYRNLMELRAGDQEIYLSDGPKQFGDWFPERIRRELCYAQNGGYVYTYLVDFDGLIFAVIIHHENFRKNLLEQSDISDFAAKAVRGRDFGMTSWSVDATEDVVVKAIWAPDSNAEVRLKYVCVMNKPQN